MDGQVNIDADKLSFPLSMIGMGIAWCCGGMMGAAVGSASTMVTIIMVLGLLCGLAGLFLAYKSLPDLKKNAQAASIRVALCMTSLICGWLSVVSLALTLIGVLAAGSYK